MSKLPNKQIRCLTDPQGKPTRVEHHGLMIRITEILEQWADTGRWWKGEHEKMFYRIQLEDGPVMEIYRDQVTNEWLVYKVYD